MVIMSKPPTYSPEKARNKVIHFLRQKKTKYTYISQPFLESRIPGGTKSST